MKNLLVLSMVLFVAFGLSGVVRGELAIDNDSSDWYADGLVKQDPVGDHGHNPTDLLAWGVKAQTDDGVRYVYSYFEDDGQIGSAMSSGNVFAATMIDVDHRSGTLTEGPLPGGSTGGGGRNGWNGPSALGHDADNGGNEFIYGDHNGYDAVPEWGPNNEGFNFWGNPADDVWQQGSAITTGTTGYGSNFIEYRVPVSTIIAEVMAGVDYNSTNPEKVTIGSLWKAGVRLAEHFPPDSNPWEGDKSGDNQNAAGGVYAVYTYLAILPGDANEDGVVNFSDYLNFSTGFGQTGAVGPDMWAMGDFNLDGVVNFSDYLELSSNYGMTRGSVAAVPEPVSLALLGLGALLLRRKS